MVVGLACVLRDEDERLAVSAMRRSVVPMAMVLWQTIATRGSARPTTSSTIEVSHACGAGTHTMTKSASCRSSAVPRPSGGSYSVGSKSLNGRAT